MSDEQAIRVISGSTPNAPSKNHRISSITFVRYFELIKDFLVNFIAFSNRKIFIERLIRGYSVRITLYMSSLLTLAFVTGCAAIPNDVDLVVQTVPSGANVVSTDGWSCTTPCTHSVTRDSQFDLEVTQSGYKSETEQIRIPEIERSSLFRNIGAGVGFVVMFVGADISSDLGTALIEAFTGEKVSVLSTGEKIGSGLLGGGIFGGIGFAIDRARDQARAERLIEVQIELEHESPPTN